MTRPRIAFITARDGRDKSVWSGILYYMARALQRHVGEVSFLGPVDLGARLLAGSLLSGASRTLFSRRFGYKHRISLSKIYARRFGAKLKSARYDVIVAPAASTEIAYLETDVPIVYLSDTTFANMLGYYARSSDLWPGSARQGDEIERRAIAGAALVFYPSRWAADSALRDYGAAASKVHVVPLGANLDQLPSGERVARRRQGGGCRLLLIGVDWERKGGEIALGALVHLLAAGLDAELTVCGCAPPRGVSHPRMKIVPFIDKNDPAQYPRFEQLLWDADFLILPTRAECYGVVFCEAGAYGLPAVASDTGGVPGAVREGVNGFLLPLSASGSDYARVIASLVADPVRYRALSGSSRRLVETTLNWDAWALTVKPLLGELVESRLPCCAREP